MMNSKNVKILLQIVTSNYQMYSLPQNQIFLNRKDKSKSK